jgi:hypothetical protein
LITAIADEHGQIQNVKSVLVLWTVDCAKFSAATFPTFELPPDDAQKKRGT